MDGGMDQAFAAVGLGATPEAYRNGMAQVAGHVHVVTTAGAAGTSGFTAIAVASVSDNPPMLLFCINRQSANGPLVEANGVFAINALPAGASDLAEAFAGRRGLQGADRFREGRWTTLVTGAPVLETALASFDCRVIEARPIATHLVVIGRVEAVRTGGEGAALAYFGRAYRDIPRD
jgi:flavin reductase (DIM6/NTAB) family NADH-FMN oxidoreductase RutF